MKQCSDCPPVGYITDKTRCEDCPHLPRSNVPRALLIEDYREKCAKMEDDMLGWKESAEAWERDARGLSDRLKTLEALARAPGSIYESVERILDDESAWIARPDGTVSMRISLAAMMIAESKMRIEFGVDVPALLTKLAIATHALKKMGATKSDPSPAWLVGIADAALAAIGEKP